MKIFVGCSSSRDIDNKYLIDCKELLNELMKDNDLVFGACPYGLMGLSHDITKSLNGKVIGITPIAYKSDLDLLDCDLELLTKSVSERTDKLIELSDAIVFLPGGIGTIYELFSVIESKRCNEFDKAVVIYNVNGYFDKLFEFMDKIYNEKFSKEKDKDNYFISTSINDIINYINNYKKENV